MAVEVDVKYLLPGALHRMRKDMTLAWIAIAIVAFGLSVLARIRFLADSEMFWPTIVGGLAALICVVFSIVGLRGIVLDQAHRMEGLLPEARRMEEGSTLFNYFIPSQGRVDRMLAERAVDMERACKELVMFYGAHPDIFANTAVSTTGKRMILTDRGLGANRELEEQEAFLHASIMAAKASFWNLHSMLWRRSVPDLVLKDSWRKYLPDTGGVFAEGMNEPADLRD